MGSPYSQLQTLRYNYSGRHIGVELYKPFTVANEKVSSSISVDGAQLGAVRESGYLKATLTSGEQTSALLDRASLGLVATGSLSDAGGDCTKYGIDIASSLDSSVHDAASLSNPLKSGEFSSPLSDTFSNTFLITQEFVGEFRGEYSYSLRGHRGAFLPFSNDTSEFDFLFFTGNSFAGRVAQLISGDDAAELDLVFFTGSYQG